MGTVEVTHWRDVAANVCLILVSTCTVTLLSEALLRAYGYNGAPESIIKNIRHVDDNILNWRYIPNSRVETGSVSYQYNDLGFRDIKHDTKKHNEKLQRVMVIGDSVSEGAGVEWDSIFASQLQTRLGHEYEVINMAMSGLNTPQEVHLLENQGLIYQPEVVILNFVLNDPDFYTEYFATVQFAREKDSTIGILGLPINPDVKRYLRSSALIYFVKERVENLLGRLTGKQETNYYLSLWQKEENRQKITDSFSKLNHLSKLHSFRTLLVIWPLLTDYSNYQFTAIHQWVTSKARENGFDVLDLQGKFSRMSFRDLQVTAEDNVHPNALGHRVAAEAVYNFLRSDEMRQKPMTFSLYGIR